MDTELWGKLNRVLIKGAEDKIYHNKKLIAKIAHVHRRYPLE